jgi:CO dehydrogenase/acetyl-CoA synthase beta subunit
MSSYLKESMSDELAVVADREGDPDLLDRIADERNVTTVEELLVWLEEHNHPAMLMEAIF